MTYKAPAPGFIFSSFGLCICYGFLGTGLFSVAIFGCFVLIKRLAGKMVSKMLYDVCSGTMNPT